MKDDTTALEVQSIDPLDPVLLDGEVIVPMRVDGRWHIGGHHGSKNAIDKLAMTVDELKAHRDRIETAIELAEGVTVDG